LRIGFHTENTDAFLAKAKKVFVVGFFFYLLSIGFYFALLTKTEEMLRLISKNFPSEKAN